MRIQLYVLREVFVAICFAAAGMLVLALPAVAVSAIHKLPGVDLRAVLFYLPLVIAGLVPYVLPLAFLLGVVSAYSRLTADNEWTAIRMTGRHPARVYVPGLVLALGMSAVTYWMVSDLLPQIRGKQTNYLIEASSRTMRELSPGRTEVKIGDFYLTARRRDGKAFLDAQVYVPPLSDEQARNLRADRIEFRFEERAVLMLFRNARTIVGGAEILNGDMTVRIDLEELTTSRESGSKSTRLRFLSSGRMREELRAGPAPERERDLRYELHYRLSLATVFGVFLLLGTSTGLLLGRRNQLIALALAAGYALGFYVLHMRLGKQLAQHTELPAELCAWSAIAVGAVAGGVLTWKAWRQ